MSEHREPADAEPVPAVPAEQAPGLTGSAPAGFEGLLRDDPRRLAGRDPALVRALQKSAGNQSVLRLLRTVAPPPVNAARPAQAPPSRARLARNLQYGNRAVGALLLRDPITSVPVRVAELDWNQTPTSAGISPPKDKLTGSLRTIADQRLKIELTNRLQGEGTGDWDRDRIVNRVHELQAKGETDRVAKLRQEFHAAEQKAIIDTLSVGPGEKDWIDRDQADAKAGPPGSPVARYRNTGRKTFCNVYANDVVAALGAYFPMFWWNGFYPSGVTYGVLKEIEDGTKEPVTVARWKTLQESGADMTKYLKPDYPKTLMDMDTNHQATWMLKWGTSMGWTIVPGMTNQQRTENAQEMVNEGNVVIAVAAHKEVPDKPTPSGHVSVVLAESSEQSALRKNGKLVALLQTQAGDKYIPQGANNSGGEPWRAAAGDAAAAEKPAKEYQWWWSDTHQVGDLYAWTGARTKTAMMPDI